MKNEVVISIKGLHMAAGEDNEDQIELITCGRYYSRQGKGYLFYDEVDEETGRRTENRMVFSADEVVLRKKGEVSVHMVFNLTKKSMAEYNMVFGRMTVGIDAREIILTENENEIYLIIRYGLDVNGSYVSDSVIEVSITPSMSGC